MYNANRSAMIRDRSSRNSLGEEKSDTMHMLCLGEPWIPTAIPSGVLLDKEPLGPARRLWPIIQLNFFAFMQTLVQASHHSRSIHLPLD
uniref:Uncharacterized protein n=1 Tax=Anguilla anguilla TaxID=7936 RepID=A0A0E9WZZ5_ANGAN